MTNLTPVESSNIESVGHDGSRMIVRFKNGGTFHYSGVTAEQHAEMLAAESLGKYFHARIRGKFPGVKVEDGAGDAPTLVERMACAAYEKNPSVLRSPHSFGYLSWDELGPWQKKGYVDGQRAALEDAREPTDSMLVPPEPFYVPDGVLPMWADPATSKASWQRLIDAALKEGK